MRINVDEGFTQKVRLPEMQALAHVIAGVAGQGDVITLRGEVGAGKTTFARAFIQSLVPEALDITSPTFNLMQSYDVALAGGRPCTLWHLDLYRLKHAEETRALGLEELGQSIMLIEWPEIMEQQLPKERLDVFIGFGEGEEVRAIRLSGSGMWCERLGTVL